MTNKSIHIDYKTFADYHDAGKQITELVDTAKQATQKAYAPYSKFFVGAAVLLNDGTIISGANQENASFPAGICAERTTLSAVSALNEQQTILHLAIAVNSERMNTTSVPAPCGICRQTLIEWESRQQKPIELWLLGPGNHLTHFKSASDLMPFGFTGEALGNK